MAVSDGPIPWTGSGMLVRAYASGLGELGLRPQVLERLSPAQREILLDPPNRLSWLDGAFFEEVMEQAMQLGGPQKVIRLGYLSSGFAFGAFLEPLVRTMLSLFGSDPATLYKRLPELTRVMLKGFRYEFNPTGARSGQVRFTYSRRTPLSTFVSWEGCFRYGHDLVKAPCIFAPVVVSPDGTQGTYDVAW